VGDNPDNMTPPISVWAHDEEGVRRYAGRESNLAHWAHRSVAHGFQAHPITALPAGPTCLWHNAQNKGGNRVGHAGRSGTRPGGVLQPRHR
jgi:hypothetical protein